MTSVVLAVIQNAANRATEKNSWQSYLKKFRKQQGAIRTDWKIYSCINSSFLHKFFKALPQDW